MTRLWQPLRPGAAGISQHSLTGLSGQDRLTFREVLSG
jgi:hypothetical protein